MKMKKIGISLAFMTGLTISGAAAAISAVTVTDASTTSVFGSVGVPTYYTTGFQFTPTESVSVYQLGIWDFNGDGLANTHEVGLWTDTGTLLTSVVFPVAGGILRDGFTYLDVAPVVLTAGSKYRIGATYFDNDSLDKLVNDVLPIDRFIFDSAIQLNIEAATHDTSGPGLDFPSTLGWGNLGFPPEQNLALGPTFEFDKVTVPEPTSLALLSIGIASLTLSRRRPKCVKLSIHSGARRNSA